MKKHFIKRISIVLLTITVIGMTGCSTGKGDKKTSSDTSNKSQQNSKEKAEDLVVVKSKDGKSQLSIPKSWKEETNLNPEAAIQVANKKQEKYVIVIPESASDFAKDIKVEDFAKIVKDNMVKSVKDANATEFTNIDINGLSGKYFEVQGEVEKIKAKYFIATVKSENNFYQVLGWTLNSKADENKAEIMNVIKSLKEIK